MKEMNSNTGSSSVNNNSSNNTSLTEGTASPAGLSKVQENTKSSGKENVKASTKESVKEESVKESVKKSPKASTTILDAGCLECPHHRSYWRKLYGDDIFGCTGCGYVHYCDSNSNTPGIIDSSTVENLYNTNPNTASTDMSKGKICNNTSNAGNTNTNTNTSKTNTDPLKGDLKGDSTGNLKEDLNGNLKGEQSVGNIVPSCSSGSFSGSFSGGVGITGGAGVTGFHITTSGSAASSPNNNNCNTITRSIKTASSTSCNTSNSYSRIGSITRSGRSGFCEFTVELESDFVCVVSGKIKGRRHLDDSCTGGGTGGQAGGSHIGGSSALEDNGANGYNGFNANCSDFAQGSLAFPPCAVNEMNCRGSGTQTLIGSGGKQTLSNSIANSTSSTIQKKITEIETIVSVPKSPFRSSSSSSINNEGNASSSASTQTKTLPEARSSASSSIYASKRRRKQTMGRNNNNTDSHPIASGSKNTSKNTSTLPGDTLFGDAQSYIDSYRLQCSEMKNGTQHNTQHNNNSQFDNQPDNQIDINPNDAQNDLNQNDLNQNDLNQNDNQNESQEYFPLPVPDEEGEQNYLATCYNFGYNLSYQEAKNLGME